MDVLNHILQVLELRMFQVGRVPITLMVLIQTGLILLGTVIFSRLLIRFLRRNVFSHARLNLGVEASISRVLHYVIMTGGVFIALEHVGIDLTALAAVGAVLMVGVGFGLQNVANNFISGIILLFERPIQVGDFVEVKGALGHVVAINARSTTINTLDNVTIVVPNSQFVAESVTNWSYRDPKMRLHINVHAAFGSDVDRVRDVLLEVGRSHPEVLGEPVPQVQFYEFGESVLRFVLLVWIGDPMRQFVIRSDLNFGVVKAFRDRGIRIPFPQHDVHVHSDKLEVDSSQKGG